MTNPFFEGYTYSGVRIEKNGELNYCAESFKAPFIWVQNTK